MFTDPVFLTDEYRRLIASSITAVFERPAALLKKLIACIDSTGIFTDCFL